MIEVHVPGIAPSTSYLNKVNTFAESVLSPRFTACNPKNAQRYYRTTVPASPEHSDCPGAPPTKRPSIERSACKSLRSRLCCHAFQLGLCVRTQADRTYCCPQSCAGCTSPAIVPQGVIYAPQCEEVVYTIYVVELLGQKFLVSYGSETLTRALDIMNEGFWDEH